MGVVKLFLQWLTDRHKKALYEALEKVKAGRSSCFLLMLRFEFLLTRFVLFAAELMILGFISLTLVFSQYYIAEICIPKGAADIMLPCKAKDPGEEKEGRRRLLSFDRRVLAGKSSTKCTDVSLLE